jgi:H+-translocating NAD(P) transhydrogenase subunit alpha
MIIGLIKEQSGENRVAFLPETVSQLIKLKVRVLYEKGAGLAACADDAAYDASGAEAAELPDILSLSDVVVKINPPDEHLRKRLRRGCVLVCVLDALTDKKLVSELAGMGITSFALEVIPRTTRAQAMDILSSMATVSGYKSVLEAAFRLPRFFPMFMTAAGTITPARVMILGAGVAGLQAVATSRKLGAVVEVFDVRSAVKEEVKSLGAKFIEVEGATDKTEAGGYAVEQTEEFLKKQAAVIHEHAIGADVIICTAQIPGKKAPLLITAETVHMMKAGSVIIDLATSTGGNCELSRHNENITEAGVQIIGKTSYASGTSSDASKMFGKNVFNFLKLLISENGELNLDFTDDLVAGTCVTHNGEIINSRVKAIHGF